MKHDQNCLIGDRILVPIQINSYDLKAFGHLSGVIQAKGQGVVPTVCTNQQL
jgi:hypothetical protein